MTKQSNAVKQPKNLSPRVQWLRDYYFQGTDRAWNNEVNAFSNGREWDQCYDEAPYYIVPETKATFITTAAGYMAASKIVPVEDSFFDLSIVERKALYSKELIVNQMPKEILPGDLLCGARFSAMYSLCLSEEETKLRNELVLKARAELIYLIDHGYGNAGATSGHLIPDYAKIIKNGFSAIYDDLKKHHDSLSEEDQKGQKGQQLRAMMTACEMPRDLAAAYREECLRRAEKEEEEQRRKELMVMADNLAVVPWKGAENFYQAIQSLWLTHMLVHGLLDQRDLEI